MTDLKVGDAVFGRVPISNKSGSGSLADYTIVPIPKDEITIKPEWLRFDQADKFGFAPASSKTLRISGADAEETRNVGVSPSTSLISKFAPPILNKNFHHLHILLTNTLMQSKSSPLAHLTRIRKSSGGGV